MGSVKQRVSPIASHGLETRFQSQIFLVNKDTHNTTKDGCYQEKNAVNEG